MTDNLGVLPFLHLAHVTTREHAAQWIEFAREQGATEEQCRRAWELWEADRKASVQIIERRVS